MAKITHYKRFWFVEWISWSGREYVKRCRTREEARAYKKYIMTPGVRRMARGAAWINRRYEGV